MNQQLLNFLSPDNETRNQALAGIEQVSSERPDDYASSLCAFLLQSASCNNANEEMQRLQLREVSSMILHKNLLSKDENFSRISETTLGKISSSILEAIEKDIGSMSWGLIKRCAEILIELTVKTSQEQDFFVKLKSFHQEVFGNRNAQKGFVAWAKFILYCLELLAEYGSMSGFVQNNSAELLSLLEQSFACGETEVLSFSTGAICMYLVSDDHENKAASLSNILDGLVNVLVSNIKGSGWGVYLYLVPQFINHIYDL